MNININSENFHNRFLSSRDNNLILQKIFKLTSIIIGIIIIFLVIIELCVNFYKSYNQDKINLYEEIRNLEDINTETSINDYLDLSKKNKSSQDEVMNSTHDDNFENKNKGIEILNFIKNERENILKFYNNVDKYTFKGKWRSAQQIPYLDNNTEGEMAMKIEKLSAGPLFPIDTLHLAFRINNGHYIDQWILVRSFTKPLVDVNYFNNSINQSLQSYVDYGQIFERVIVSTVPCSSVFHFDLGKNFNNESMIIEKFSGSFNTDCSMNNITFDVELEYPYEDFIQISFYSVIVSLIAISQIFNAIWLNYKLSDSITFANTISHVTILQNIIWNAFGCLSHFFLSVNFEDYTFHFGIPAFLYFVNFSIFELRLLYSIWRLKNLREINDFILMRKKLIRFYLYFYISMFLSLFYVLKFYFESPYIFFAILFTWIPQIIYNTLYKNNISLPLMNIFLTNLNKVFFPFYVRGCSGNLFQLKTDISFVLFCSFCLIIEICILYSQTLFGPRWFLPKYFRSQGFDFYKTKEEVMKIRPDSEYHDCVICLLSLLGNENFKYFSNDFIAAGEESLKPKFLLCQYLTKFVNIFTNFHEINLNLNRKSFMVTPCKHVFHTPCLESWFKQKKECPCCRQEIENTYI